MVSQSWDGKRFYYTSSLLANWDKAGADNEQFLKAYTWDGNNWRPGSRSTSWARGSVGPPLMASARPRLYAK